MKKLFSPKQLPLKMWNIGEIEVKLDAQDVSRIPKNWLLYIDGKVYCYWPKSDPEPKIRSCTKPETDWNIYKCRILMNGETFKTYQEAIEAEKKYEKPKNANSKRQIDWKGQSENKIVKLSNVEKSTEKNSMKNEFSGKATSFSDMLVSFTDDSNVSLLDDSDMSLLDNIEVIGNDSFEYNQRIKYGGAYMSNKNLYMEGLKLVPMSNYPEKKYDLDSPQDSNFSINDADMLTSSFLDTIRQKSKEIPVAADLMSHISKIDLMTSCFVKDIRDELQLLKQLVQVQTTSSVVEGEAMNSNDIKLLEKHGDNRENEVNVTFVYASDGEKIIDANIKHSELMSASNAEMDVEPIIENVNAADSLNIDDVLNAEAPNDHNGGIDDIVNANNDKAPSLIRLPIANPDHYKEVEDLFHKENAEEVDDYTPLEKALVEHLKPFTNEDEGTYMERTIDMVFANIFLLESVSWKTERNRVNISKSRILRCWKNSFETKFREDEDYKRFIAHFRRVKSAKRAAKKSAERKNNLKKN